MCVCVCVCVCERERERERERALMACNLFCQYYVVLFLREREREGKV